MSAKNSSNKNWIWNASLSLFFAVLMPATTALAGTATLRWNAPTMNGDSTPLTDLGGFKIYYGTAPDNYTTVLDVGNVTTYQVGDLSAATYYFAVTAYNTEGIESSYSNKISKTITNTGGGTGPTPVGYNLQWLIATIAILMLTGGYLLRNGKEHSR